MNSISEKGLISYKGIKSNIFRNLLPLIDILSVFFYKVVSGFKDVLF